MLSELLYKSEDFLAGSTMVQYQRKIRKPGRSGRKGGQILLSEAAACQGQLLPYLSTPHQHPFTAAPHPWLTLEGVDDGEEVEGDEAEDARGEGEEDQCPGNAQQDAQPKEGKNMLELAAFVVLPEDLPDHGPQHDRVKKKHQAEETQVHSVMDQGARNPASGSRRVGRGLHCVTSRGHEFEGLGGTQRCGASPEPSLMKQGGGIPPPPCTEPQESYRMAEEIL